MSAGRKGEWSTPARGLGRRRARSRTPGAPKAARSGGARLMADNPYPRSPLDGTPATGAYPPSNVDISKAITAIKRRQERCRGPPGRNRAGPASCRRDRRPISAESTTSNTDRPGRQHCGPSPDHRRLPAASPATRRVSRRHSPGRATSSRPDRGRRGSKLQRRQGAREIRLEHCRAQRATAATPAIARHARRTAQDIVRRRGAEGRCRRYAAGADRRGRQGQESAWQPRRQSSERRRERAGRRTGAAGLDPDGDPAPRRITPARPDN